MLTREEKEKKFLLLKEKKKRQKIKVFWEFCLHMDEEFFSERADVLKPIAINLQRLIDPLPGMTEIDIMNVSLPPRTGKSYLVTLFAGWGLGKFPKESIMRNTVTSKLYKKFSNDLKNMITGDSHSVINSDGRSVNKYSEIFPDVKLLTTAVEGWSIEGNKQGVTYFGSGIEGNIIGLGASLLSILDDSIASEFEALNEYALEKKWSWFTSVADSREENGCKRLFVGTRWSKRDIVGRFEELGFFRGDDSINIVVSALKDDGTSYCEKIHTTKKLLEKKLITSDVIWEAEWQQNPIEAKGLVFPRSELNRFNPNMYKSTLSDRSLVVIDVADEGTDYLASVYVETIQNKVYVLNVVFSTDEVEITTPRVGQQIIDNKPDLTRIESNFDGKGYKKSLQAIVPKSTVFKLERTKVNKHTKIIMKSGYIRQNFYFIDDEFIVPGSDYYHFMNILCAYNKQGKVAHDDAPDVCAMVCQELESYAVPGIRSL